MITILPIQKIISVVATIYVVSVILVTLLLSGSEFTSIKIALRGAFILELAIFLLFIIGWRWLWKKVPVLNEWVYPDLNGEWDATIHWTRGSLEGTKEARAYIKQNFFKLSMELVSDESESETLLVTPKKDPESARPILYYIYRNESAQGLKNPQAPHKGAAILKLDPTSIDVLRGNYFTDRSTSGHFELRRNKI